MKPFGFMERIRLFTICEPETLQCMDAWIASAEKVKHSLSKGLASFDRVICGVPSVKTEELETFCKVNDIGVNTVAVAESSPRKKTRTLQYGYLTDVHDYLHYLVDEMHWDKTVSDNSLYAFMSLSCVFNPSIAGIRNMRVRASTLGLVSANCPQFCTLDGKSRSLINPHFWCATRSVLQEFILPAMKEALSGSEECGRVFTEKFPAVLDHRLMLAGRVVHECNDFVTADCDFTLRPRTRIPSYAATL